MMLDTIVGPLDDSLLSKMESTKTTEAGTLRTTSFFYEGVLVKCDQVFDVSQAAMEAAGIATL